MPKTHALKPYTFSNVGIVQQTFLALFINVIVFVWIDFVLKCFRTLPYRFHCLKKKKKNVLIILLEEEPSHFQNCLTI